METFADFSQPILFFVKIAVLIFLLLYVVFAIVLVRQVKLMTETLELGHESSIRMIILIHLVISILVFVLSIFIL